MNSRLGAGEVSRESEDKTRPLSSTSAAKMTALLRRCQEAVTSTVRFDVIIEMGRYQFFKINTISIFFN